MNGRAVPADTTVANDALIAAVSGTLQGVSLGIAGKFLRQQAWPVSPRFR